MPAANVVSGGSLRWLALALLAVVLAILLWPQPSPVPSARAGAGSYDWTAEWRRRYRVEHRANVAHAEQVRRLRAALRDREVVWPWNALGSCESGLRWSYNGSSGFDGALQFHPDTWSRYRPSSYPSFAYEASPRQQVAVAEYVLASEGWKAWPVCSRRMGLR